MLKANDFFVYDREFPKSEDMSVTDYLSGNWEKILRNFFDGADKPLKNI